MAGVSDEVFARYINEIGNATIEQIEAAQREQVLRARAGKPTALADVLVEQGVLTPAIRENIEKKLLAQQEGGLRKLGNYKLLKKLGEGGMGAVYLAEDTLAGRKVALKVLPKKHAGDSEFLTRFRREAKATGKLNHVNIVSAFSVGEELGNHFYAMEYCDGEPLDAKQKREQVLEWDKAIEIITQVARGLKHAHEHGFIHRDIKPANIFYTSEGVAKILDLGLSKNILDAEQSFNTQTGVAMGTPHYISPEQARGEKTIDGRTDIYSLGATLYHLVTGQTPFQGSTAAMIMMKHLNDQLPNPQDIREDIPDSVVHVIQKMMAKDPKDRYVDCAELLTDLELVIDGKSPSSLALDVGKSSIAMPRARKADVVAAADHMRASRKGATNRHEPIAARAERRADKSDAAPKKNQTPLLIGGGVAVLGALILVVALMKGGSSSLAPQGTDKTVAENKTNTTTLTPPQPVPETTTVPAQSPPANAGTLRPGLWATYWTGTENNWFQQFQFAEPDSQPSKFWPNKPNPRLPADGFAVRWVGIIRITEASNYRFSAKAEGKIRVLFDGKEVGAAPGSALGVKLVPGEYPVLIEFFDAGGQAKTEFRYTYSSINGWRDLPAEMFFHTAEQELGATAVAGGGVDDAWIKSVQALPADKQVDAVVAKLREANPGWNGAIKDPKIENGAVTAFSAFSGGLKDISAFRALTALRFLELRPAPGSSVTLENLAPLNGMQLMIVAVQSNKIRDISPLRGLPLTNLYIANNPIDDYSILSSFNQLTTLDMATCKITSIDPIKALPLKYVHLTYDPVRDRAILKSMTTLEKINNMPVADFWKANDGATTGGVDDAWIKSVQALPGVEQVKKVIAKLRELNSQYDGAHHAGYRDGKVTDLSILNVPVSDISPLRGLSLTGLKLNNLPLVDITPLKGMPLRHLELNSTQVKDLSALQGMPLNVLALGNVAIDDISPIAGLNLSTLYFSPSPQITGLDALRAMKTLKTINGTNAAEFWAKYGNAPAAGKVLVSENFEKFDQGKLPAGWWLLNKAPAVLVDQPGRGKVLRARREEGLAVTLDPAVVNGHTLRISAMAYCPLGYTKLNDWAKPRLLLKVDNNEDSARSLEPDQRDWKQLLISSWKIPADAKVVRVYLAVPLIQAEVFFDDLLIEMDPDPKSAPPQTSAATVRPANVPADAKEFQGSWYKLFLSPAINTTYLEAKKRCEDLGGRLAIVDSKEKNDFLVTLIPPTHQSYIFAGASDDEKEGEWKWLNGRKLEYSNWEPGQPNSGKGANRLGIGRNGWNDQTDVNVNGYFCEWEPAGIAKASARPANVPVDAVEIDGRWFKVFKVLPERMRWDQVKARCEQMGGRLAMPKTKEVLDRLLPMTAPETGMKTALGGYKENGAWKWLDGEPVAEAIYPAAKGADNHILHVANYGPQSRLVNDCPGVKPQGSFNMEGFICEWGPAAADGPNWKNAIDVLALFNRDLDSIRSAPTMVGSDMHTGPAAPAIYQLPYLPPEEYDVRVELSTPELKGWIVFLLSKAGKSFAWSTNRVQAGFDGMPGAEPVRITLPTAKRTTVLIQVRNDRATASIDGVYAGEVIGNYSEAKMEQLRDKRLLGITTHLNPAVIHKFEVLEVKGKGLFLRPDDPAAKEAEKKRSAK